MDKNMGQDDEVIYDEELPPPAPPEPPMFEGLEGAALVERALSLAETYTYGLPEKLREAVLWMHGAELANALLALEGFGVWTRERVSRTARLRWSFDLDSYRPPGEPSTWTPDAVQEWIERWSGHTVAIEATKEWWAEWKVSIQLGDMKAQSWRAKTRKAGLQEIVKYDMLWRELVRLDVANSGWVMPSDAALRSRQSARGRTRLDSREEVWEALWSDYQTEVDAWEVDRRERIRAWMRESAELLGYLEAAPKLRNLTDLKAALPEGWEARSYSGTNTFVGKTVTQINYSVTGPSGLSWLGYQTHGAEEALGLFVNTVRYHAVRPFEEFLRDLDKGYHIPFAVPRKPSTPPPTPDHVSLG